MFGQPMKVLQTFLMNPSTIFKPKKNSEKSFLLYMTKMKRQCNNNKVTTLNINLKQILPVTLMIKQLEIMKFNEKLMK